MSMRKLEELRQEIQAIKAQHDAHKEASKTLRAKMDELTIQIFDIIEEENSPQERLFPVDPTDHDEPMPKPKRGRRKSGTDPKSVRWET